MVSSLYYQSGAMCSASQAQLVLCASVCSMKDDVVPINLDEAKLGNI